jgi:enterochelin esterase-like enzyme
MIDTAALVDNLVATLRDISELVAEMNGDPAAIYAYHDQYPKRVSLLASPAEVNRNLRLLWISVGKQDFLYEANLEFADTPKSKGVNVTYQETEGSHVWSVWRKNLNETAAVLFTPRR